VEVLIEMLKRSGVPITVRKDSILIKGNGKVKNTSLKGMNVRTHEYPGFPTDLQAPMTVYLSQVKGESLVFETVFEGRLSYTQDLVRMGADIAMWNPHQVMVHGPKPLVGRDLESPDIRAGLAFVIAAIVAKGDSVINNVYHIDRGYEEIEKRLRTIGVDIERVK
jgi:UDP-N-acetylglucosamine 1-carboxyvinyltransferase